MQVAIRILTAMILNNNAFQRYRTTNAVVVNLNLTQRACSVDNEPLEHMRLNVIDACKASVGINATGMTESQRYMGDENCIMGHSAVVSHNKTFLSV